MNDPIYFNALYRSAPSEYLSEDERRMLFALLSTGGATQEDRAFVSAMDAKVRAAEAAWREEAGIEIGAAGSRAVVGAQTRHHLRTAPRQA